MQALTSASLPNRRKLTVTDSAKKTRELVAEKLRIDPNYRKPGLRFDAKPLPHPDIRCFVMHPMRPYIPRSYTTGSAMQY